jgi:hypothetical protein
LWQPGFGTRPLLPCFTARTKSFTRLAADRIGEGLGGFIVEASAALSILIYLAILWFSGDRVKNSVELVLIIRCIPAIASALAQ